MSKRIELQEEINKLQKKLDDLPKTKTEVLEEEINALKLKNLMLEAENKMLQATRYIPTVWPYPNPWQDPIISWGIDYAADTDSTVVSLKDFSNDTITLYKA